MNIDFLVILRMFIKKKFHPIIWLCSAICRNTLLLMTADFFFMIWWIVLLLTNIPQIQIVKSTYSHEKNESYMVREIVRKYCIFPNNTILDSNKTIILMRKNRLNGLYAHMVTKIEIYFFQWETLLKIAKWYMKQIAWKIPTWLKLTYSVTAKGFFS